MFRWPLLLGIDLFGIMTNWAGRVWNAKEPWSFPGVSQQAPSFEVHMESCPIELLLRAFVPLFYVVTLFYGELQQWSGLVVVSVAQSVNMLGYVAKG